MAIECFGTKYFAISNLFVRDIDGNFFTFPSPYSIKVESDFKQNSTIEICYASFYDSPLVLDYIFDLFFYVISFDGKIETFFLRSVHQKEEPRNESYGYKGIYSFQPDLILQNNTLLNDKTQEGQFYGDLKRIKQTILPNSGSPAR
ncbi:hypothetical protein Pam2_26 [Pseudanabaena phage Pam2]|nr:hypothetical protein Pam2_26 [Pseudanabaena phage Pam2]